MRQDIQAALAMSLKRRSDELLAHPNLPLFRRTYIQNILELYENNTFLTRLLIEAGRSVIFFQLLCLDAAHDPEDRTTWPTKALLKESVRAYGVSSARRLDDIVGRLVASGYMESRKTATDRRVRILVPTDRMVSHDLDWLVAQYSPLRCLDPAPNLDRVMSRDEEYRRVHRRLAHDWFWYSVQLMSHNPHAMFFMVREAGTLVLMKLVEASAADSNGLARNVSLTDFAQRFGISRTHVRAILKDAEGEGLLRRGRDGVELSKALKDAFDLFVVEVMVGLEGMHRQTMEALA